MSDTALVCFNSPFPRTLLPRLIHACRLLHEVQRTRAHRPPPSRLLCLHAPRCPLSELQQQHFGGWSVFRCYRHAAASLRVVSTVWCSQKYWREGHSNPTHCGEEQSDSRSKIPHKPSVVLFQGSPTYLAQALSAPSVGPTAPLAPAADASAFPLFVSDGNSPCPHSRDPADPVPEWKTQTVIFPMLTIPCVAAEAQPSARHLRRSATTRSEDGNLRDDMTADLCWHNPSPPQARCCHGDG